MGIWAGCDYICIYGGYDYEVDQCTTFIWSVREVSSDHMDRVLDEEEDEEERAQAEVDSLHQVCVDKAIGLVGNE